MAHAMRRMARTPVPGAAQQPQLPPRPTAKECRLLLIGQSARAFASVGPGTILESWRASGLFPRSSKTAEGALRSGIGVDATAVCDKPVVKDEGDVKASLTELTSEEGLETCIRLDEARVGRDRRAAAAAPAPVLAPERPADAGPAAPLAAPAPRAPRVPVPQACKEQLRDFVEEHGGWDISWAQRPADFKARATAIVQATFPECPGGKFKARANSLYNEHQKRVLHGRVNQPPQ